MKESGRTSAIAPEMLWEQYHEQISNFVRLRTNGRPDTEDIVQTVFLKAWRSLPALQDESKLRAWMYQIARNAIKDHFRKGTKAEPLPEHAQSSTEETLDFTDEAIAGMRGVIPYLPEKYREAIELSELNGVPQKELSERLGISYSGAKSRVQWGREMVRDLMNSCCRIESDRYGHILDYTVLYPKPRSIKKAKAALSPQKKEARSASREPKRDI